MNEEVYFPKLTDKFRNIPMPMSILCNIYYIYYDSPLEILVSTLNYRRLKNHG